jgi:predicted choloylglycine hydrolase
MILDFAENTPYLASVQADAPDLFEEMQGVAEGAGVDLKQIFVYQSFDEFFVFLLTSGTLDMGTTGHCTTAGVYGRADKPNYVGHNNDIPTYHEEVVTVLHIKYPDSDLEVLQSAFAGQIGQTGVNNRGVAVGINTLANLPGGNGLPVSFNVRKILESGDLDEAIAYLKNTRFAQAMNYMIGDRERVVSVETWDDQAQVLDIYDGDYAVHTNHALGEETPRTFEMTAEMGGGSYGFTMERLALGTELLSADIPGITLESFQGVFKTRPILVYPGKPTGRTLMNMVAEIPKQGSPVLYLTPDSPNVFGHARFTF